MMEDKKVSGITIQLDGDTSALVAKLNGVEENIRKIIELAGVAEIKVTAMRKATTEATREDLLKNLIARLDSEVKKIPLSPESVTALTNSIEVVGTKLSHVIR